jgi:hypothetical protein
MRTEHSRHSMLRQLPRTLPRRLRNLDDGDSSGPNRLTRV